MNENFVKLEALRALSTEELQREAEQGGPAELMREIERELQSRRPFEADLSRSAEILAPQLGNAGWGCQHRQGGWLSDAEATPEAAIAAAELALATDIPEGPTLSYARRDELTTEALGVAPGETRVLDADAAVGPGPEGELEEARGELAAAHEEHAAALARFGADSRQAREALDGVSQATGRHARARAVELRQSSLCSCEVEDDGDGESGPRLSVTKVDEACSQHGRSADPEGWAEAEAQERGYVLSGLRSFGLAWAAGDSAYEAELLAAVEAAEARLMRALGADDGHNVDRALYEVAEAEKAGSWYKRIAHVFQARFGEPLVADEEHVRGYYEEAMIAAETALGESSDAEAEAVNRAAAALALITYGEDILAERRPA